MSRRLIALNVLLLGVILLSGYWIVRELTAPRALPQASTPKPAAQSVGTAAAPDRGPRPEQRPLYNVIAAKNLFSATRTENTTTVAVVATPPPKLYLHGVIVDAAKSRAFIEDVTAKSTFGYAVGDAVGGGRLEAVKADRVVIARPEGPLEVMLRDPSKPQPPAAAGAPGATAAPGAPTPAAAARTGVRAPIPPAAGATLGVQPPGAASSAGVQPPAAASQGIQPPAATPGAPVPPVTPGVAVPPGPRLLRPDLMRPRAGEVAPVKPAQPDN